MKNVLFILFGTLALGMLVKANQEPPLELESISDVNLSYFSTMPNVGWGRDPFLKTPGFAKVDSKHHEDPPRLEAILFNDKNPTALVNGTVVSTGEYIEGKRVAKIGQNFILLEDFDSTIEVTIPPSPKIQKVLEIKEHQND